MPTRRWNWQYRSGYILAVYFAVIGIVFTAVGVRFFPFPPDPPNPLRLWVNPVSTMPIEWVQLTVSDATAAGYVLTVSFTALSRERDATSTDTSGVGVILPIGLAPADGTPHAEQLGDGRWRVDSEPVALETAGGEGGYLAELTFGVVGESYGYGVGGSEVLVRFPEISVSQREDHEPAEIEVTLPVADTASLRWGANPPAETTDSTATWRYTWAEGQALEASATNFVTVRDQQILTFVSGALFAIGTSALLAVIPEALRERITRRREELVDSEARPRRTT